MPKVLAKSVAVEMSLPLLVEIATREINFCGMHWLVLLVLFGLVVPRRFDVPFNNVLGDRDYNAGRSVFDGVSTVFGEAPHDLAPSHDPKINKQLAQCIQSCLYDDCECMKRCRMTIPHLPHQRHLPHHHHHRRFEENDEGSAVYDNPYEHHHGGEWAYEHGHGHGRHRHWHGPADDLETNEYSGEGRHELRNGERFSVTYEHPRDRSDYGRREVEYHPNYAGSYRYGGNVHYY